MPTRVLLADMGDAVDAMATGTYVLHPGGAGTYDDAGRYVPPAPAATMEITAGIYPLSGEEVQRLPEGVGTAESYWCFTRHVLSTADAPTGRSADAVELTDGLYEVTSVEKWNEVGGYVRALLTKVAR